MSTEKRASRNLPFSMPGFWRFGWMVLLQPAPLDAMYRRWGFEGRVSLRAVVQRARAGHAAARALLRHSALWILAFVPLAATLVVWVLTGSLETIRWQGMLGGLATALTAWFLVSWYDIRPATRGAVLLSSPSAAVFNAASLEGAAGDTLQMTAAYLLALFVGMLLFLLYLQSSQKEREDEGFGERLLDACLGALLFELCLLLACLPLGIGVLVAGDIPEATSMMLLVGVAFCVALEVTLGIGWMAILPPLFVGAYWTGHETAGAMALLAAILTSILLRMAPRLQSFLRRVAAADKELGAALLHETSASSIKQVSESGKRVWAELQCDALEELANARAFHRVVAFDLPFFPDFKLLADDSPLRAFRAVARDLAMHGQTQRRKRDALTHAAQVMKAQQVNLSKKASDDPAAGPFASAAELWLEVIEHEREELEKEAAAHPEVPAVFVAGPPLTPDEEELRPLFKGRRDLAQSIEQDLLPGKRGLMVLYGQRRMGKTSLRKYLPRLLGSGTVVVDLDFQEASGSRYRDVLHRWILEEVAKEIPVHG